MICTMLGWINAQLCSNSITTSLWLNLSICQISFMWLVSKFYVFSVNVIMKIVNFILAIKILRNIAQIL